MTRERTQLGRHPERGRDDRGLIDAILDEALVCHVGFVADGYPTVIPTIHARSSEILYLHGSPASRLLQAAPGAEVCVTVTLLDGIVMARSAFNHSMNYRSVMVFGRPRVVTDPDEKQRALKALVEHVAKGRWADARHPSPSEITATTVLAVSLDEASAKVRSGPPIDEANDLGLSVWAGVVPLRTIAGNPVPDPLLAPEIDLPDYAREYRRPQATDEQMPPTPGGGA
jgi:nitroimidazol reductase NimA-like FMN-containing flavoprotein (pyridoxamine 5'-phosphate oxidase superfamily)